MTDFPEEYILTPVDLSFSGLYFSNFISHFWAIRPENGELIIYSNADIN
jgi:hypothetical protein